ncbi:hypothetical protein EVAR_4029_1 [Eumeta japonica]|uniref:Uncharacterized protein n=1 Tax=Eumeta variegata TaxID=151549 RepID=A0A4C1T6D3_EUMVA|nr:hypothetical protein EVAR_4029_1 [Eumeta japonica]
MTTSWTDGFAFYLRHKTRGSSKNFNCDTSCTRSLQLRLRSDFSAPSAGRRRQTYRRVGVVRDYGTSLTVGLADRYCEFVAYLPAAAIRNSDVI